MKTKKRNNKIFTNKNIFKYFLIGIVFCSLIMIQNYRINQINLEIIDLEGKVKNATMMNDSLEGQVMSKRDLNKVERIATKKYGMVKATEKNYNYISVKKDNNNTLANAKNKTAKDENGNIITNFFGALANN